MDTGASGGVGLLRRALGIVALNLVPVTGLLSVSGAARAGDVVGQSVSVSKHASRGSIEIVEFPDRQHMSISVVRGTDPAGSPRVRREIMTFGTETAHHVAVFRGSAEPAARPAEDAAAQKALEQIDGAGSARRGGA